MAIFSWWPQERFQEAPTADLAAKLANAILSQNRFGFGSPFRVRQYCGAILCPAIENRRGEADGFVGQLKHNPSDRTKYFHIYFNPRPIKLAMQLSAWQTGSVAARDVTDLAANYVVAHLLAHTLFYPWKLSLPKDSGYRFASRHRYKDLPSVESWCNLFAEALLANGRNEAERALLVELSNIQIKHYSGKS